VHERLRVDVLVVLHEIQAALQPFVDDAARSCARTSRVFGFVVCAEQRPAEFVEALALDDDAGRRAAERLDVGDRKIACLPGGAALRGLKLKTLPMIDAVTFVIDPSSNNDRS